MESQKSKYLYLLKDPVKVQDREEYKKIRELLEGINCI